MVRKLATVFLASLLVLQSIAALASPCLMNTGEQASEVGADGMDHSEHHGMSTPAADDTTSGDCCSGGYCSQDGCSSLSQLAHTGYIGTVARPTSTFQLLTPTAPQWSPGSLFRPPSV